MIVGLVLVTAFVILFVYIFFKTDNWRYKIFAILMILLIIFIYITILKIINISWISRVFKNIKIVMKDVIRINWTGNLTNSTS